MVVGERVKGGAVALVVVVLASLWLASRESTNQILVDAPLGLTALRVALGPVTGWVEAARTGSIRMALWGLLPATVFTVGPLALWVTSRAWLWLVVATAVWVAVGYFYAVAISV
jgi:hypothetical protein